MRAHNGKESTPTRPPSVERVARALAEKGVNTEITTFPQSTRTADEAAAALGCQVAQIVKSLVFMVDEKQPIVALVSGAHRADVAKLRQAVRGEVRQATAQEAKEATGYAIGGVPPLGHRQALPIFIDPTLLQYERVWAAAGHPTTVFPIDPHELVAATGGSVIDLKMETS